MRQGPAREGRVLRVLEGVTLPRVAGDGGSGGRWPARDHTGRLVRAGKQEPLIECRLRFRPLAALFPCVEDVEEDPHGDPDDRQEDLRTHEWVEWPDLSRVAE